jgi:[citrate (pro-3S)-lyase] ligase
MAHPLPLISASDRSAAKALVDGTCLRFEEGYDDLLGIFEAGRLAACGARAGRVLKMLVVASEHRGGGLLGEIICELMRRGTEQGVSGYFIFTRPTTAPVFQHLGFKPLVATTQAALLEHGNGLYRYLRQRSGLMHSGENATVMMSADPFTVGHRALVEHAASLADTVYVLVQSEGNFLLPLQTRLELARQGTAHVSNAVVTDAGAYALGAATFPAYFLDPGEVPDQVRLELDADLFGQHLAPAFQIRTRVIGSEPGDPTIRRYNSILRQRLPRWNVRVEEIPRVKFDGRWVDTRWARRALVAGDTATVAALTPGATRDCLFAALHSSGITLADSPPAIDHSQRGSA